MGFDGFDFFVVGKLLKTLQQFPLVNGEGEDVDAAVLKLVQSLPRMDARLQRTKGKNFLRKRMLNLLVSPAFYSSLGNTRFNVDAIPEVILCPSTNRIMLVTAL